MRRNLLIGLLPLLFHPQISAGQMQEEPPERVEVSDLLRSPGRYDGRRVIVPGELRGGDMEDMSNDVYRLRGSNALREVRVGLSRSSMGSLRFLEGQKVLVTGTFWDLVSQCYESPMSGVACHDPRLREYAALSSDYRREEKRYFIGAVAVDPLGEELVPEEPEPEEEEEPADIDVAPGELIDLRDLVRNPQPYLDKRVSITGKFRGNNIYGDLSFRTKKTPRDFIVKVADAAIWVTGRRPRGKGFDLNPRMRRDTGKWLKVTGVPWMEEGMVYLRAERLELVPDPDDPALEPVEDEELEEEAAEKPPPEVTFSIPLDGERGIPLDGEFRIQFSNDMNARSFDRNVDLLYAGDDGTGNPFPEMQIRYEGAQRTLVVTPGKILDPDKELLLILYNGVVDEHGKPLVAIAEEDDFPDAAVILRFFTVKRQ